jgi:hypothetical protein
MAELKKGLILREKFDHYYHLRQQLAFVKTSPYGAS